MKSSALNDSESLNDIVEKVINVLCFALGPPNSKNLFLLPALYVILHCPDIFHYSHIQQQAVFAKFN